jgi:hypothetical protein
LYDEINSKNLSRQEVVSRFIQKSEFKILQAIGGSLTIPNGPNIFNMFLKYLEGNILSQIALLK